MDEHSWYNEVADYTKAEESIPYVDYERPKQEANQVSSSIVPQPLDEKQSPASSASWKPRRGSPKKSLYIAGAVLSAVVVIVAASSALLLHIKSSPTPIGPAAGSFRYAACPFKPGAGIIEGKEVSCGYLIVLEDRSHPGGSTIHLAIAIFKALHSNPASDPVVFLQGGPGGGILNDLGAKITSENLDSMTMGHDLILLDQRGTGYSRPLLNCPEFTNYQLIAEYNNASPDQADLDAKAAEACHARLTHSGVNLQAYTTIADATDVHDLIHALHYRQVNLYGVSYGTRLALTVMRLFPSDIRSVVLDSAVPTQINLFNTEPYVIQHAFDVLFHGCAASRACNLTYPQLESLFYQTITDLNNNPVTFMDPQQGSVQLNGDMLLSFIYQAMYVTQLIPMLPAAIVQISEGNYSFLTRYTDYLMDIGISEGMYYSVECGEDMAFTTLQKLDTSVNVLRPEIRQAILTSLQSEFAICQVWGQPPVPAMQKQPVTSSVPTLILSGEYDPITPPSNGQLLEKTLSKSFFFLFPATGHGVFDTASCPDSIISTFLQSPIEKPTAACILKMHEPNFQ
ncbi:MAG TPA: alpha/beta hydrolase [Ktedonobacteraceae bacterium]